MCHWFKKVFGCKCEHCKCGKKEETKPSGMETKPEANQPENPVKTQ